MSESHQVSKCIALGCCCYLTTALKKVPMHQQISFLKNKIIINRADNSRHRFAIINLKRTSCPNRSKISQLRSKINLNHDVNHFYRIKLAQLIKKC